MPIKLVNIQLIHMIIYLICSAIWEVLKSGVFTRIKKKLNHRAIGAT